MGRESSIIYRAENGVIYIPSLHDGLLLGMVLGEETSLDIYLLTERKEKINILFSNLITLNANNFREGNIVSQIRFFNKKNCPLEFVRCAYGYSEIEGDKFLHNRMKELEGFDWSLVEIVESYGCSLVALSGSPFLESSIVRVSPVPP